MALIVAGVNHQTAPIEIREKLALASSDIGPTLDKLKSESGAREAVVLTTCNRTEFWAVEGEQPASSFISRLMSERLGADASSYMYVRQDRDAVSHLFRVASGLDSMILGEAQIHGQVRDAWESCRGYSGVALNRLYQTGLMVGSRVREQTGIGRGAASVSSAAVQLSKKIFGSLSGRRAMVLGAGDVAAIAIDCLRDEGVKVAIVANRSYERAQALAEEHGATAMHYDECWNRLHTVDVVICSTASPHTIVGVQHVAPAIAARGDRPLCILDIALPRDVDAEVGSIENVFLYDLDDLRAAAAANIDRRQEDVPAAESIIAGEVDKYWDWLAGLEAVPVVADFRSRMDQVRADELANALRRLGNLSPQQTAALDHFSRALMNKFLHEPSVRLRTAAANGRGLGVIDAARYLFGLESKSTEEKADKVKEPDE
ncbi:MAG: glutamyl-tRNA reductase [Gemmatimonadaceae bacterium]